MPSEQAGDKQVPGQSPEQTKSPIPLTNRSSAIGGQVTLFSKEDCPYCVKLHETVDKCVRQVLQKYPQGQLEWKIINCQGANASLCVRLTGSFSVPHIFFNEEYVGDCSKTCTLCDEPDEEKNVIFQKLTAIATGPRMKRPFPPSPDATIIKVTDEIAFSPQPSENQMNKLGSLGFRSVLNVSSPLEASHYEDEKELLNAGASSKQAITYVSRPLVNIDLESLLDVVSQVKTLCKPMLVHCDTGQRALVVALLCATEGDHNVMEADIVQWGEDLGLDIKSFSSIAYQAAIKLRTTPTAKDLRGDAGITATQNVAEPASKRVKEEEMCECECECWTKPKGLNEPLD